MTDTLSFRLYKVETIKNNGRKPMLTGQLNGKSMKDFMYEQMEQLKTPQLRAPSRYIKPEDLRSINDEDDIAGYPCFCIEELRVVGNVIAATVDYGRYGEMPWLFDRAGHREDIRKKAASAQYEIRLVFPESNEGEPTKNVCFMACKMNGRSDQGKNLLQYISYIYLRSVSIISPQDSTETLPTGEWYRFAITSVIDSGRFDDVLQAANPQEVTLEMHGADGFGQRNGRKITLTLSDIRPGWKIRVAKVLRKWIRGSQKNLGMTAYDSAQDIAGLISKKDFPVPKKLLSKGKIKYVENGKPKTVSADTADQLFVYPMPEGSTENEMWVSAGDRLSLIAASDDEGRYDLSPINV